VPTTPAAERQISPTANHTLAIAELGGATLDDEENYLIKKLCGGGLGMVWCVGSLS